MSTSNYKLTDNIVINDTYEVLRHVDSYVDMDSTGVLDAIHKFVNENTNTIFYFNRKGEGCSQEDAYVVWVDIGIKDTLHRPLLLSAVRNNTASPFEGHFIGTAQYLTETFCKYYTGHAVRTNINRFKEKYKRKVAERKSLYVVPESDTSTIGIINNSSSSASTGVIERCIDNEDTQVRVKKDSNVDIADDIIEWEEKPGMAGLVSTVKSSLLVDKWETSTGLQRYLTIIGARIKNYVDKGCVDYYVKNAVGHVIVNTGLLNRFGLYIFMMYRYNLPTDSYTPALVVDSKIVYIDNRFTREDACKELKAISFVDADAPELSLDIRDYDISYSTLTHSIIERANRFPESLRNIPPNVIADRVMSELELGLRICSHNENYAKRLYNAKQNALSWALPLRVTNSMNEDPELVMVIREKEGYFGVRTVLPYNEIIRDSIRCVSPYADLW